MANVGVNTTYTTPFTWTVLDKTKEIKTVQDASGIFKPVNLNATQQLATTSKGLSQVNGTPVFTKTVLDPAKGIKMVQGANGVWKAGTKLGGKALGAAGVAVGEAIKDAPELVQSFKEKRGAQGVGSFVTKVGGTVGSTVAGTAVGSGIGTTIGAGIGGVAGAFLGGVGAVPGAAVGGAIGNAVGGFVGGLAGGIGGSWLFGKVADGVFGKNKGDAEAKTESNKAGNDQVAAPSTKPEEVPSSPKPTTVINMPPLQITPFEEQALKLEKGKTLGDLVLANKKELSEKYGTSQLWGEGGLVDKVAKENGYTGFQDEKLKHLEVGHSFKLDA